MMAQVDQILNDPDHEASTQSVSSQVLRAVLCIFSLDSEVSSIVFLVCTWCYLLLRSVFASDTFS